MTSCTLYKDAQLPPSLRGSLMGLVNEGQLQYEVGSGTNPWEVSPILTSEGLAIIRPLAIGGASRFEGESSQSISGCRTCAPRPVE